MISAKIIVFYAVLCYNCGKFGRAVLKRLMSELKGVYFGTGGLDKMRLMPIILTGQDRTGQDRTGQDTE